MFWDILKVTIYEHVEKQAEAYLLQKSDIESVFHRFYAIFLYIRDTVVVRNSVSVVKILFSFYKVLDQKHKILLELESRARRSAR